MLKKAKVIMLPTKDEKTPVELWGKWLFSCIDGKRSNRDPKPIGQHLYIVSGDKIKDKDWCINKNEDTLFQVDGITEDTKGLEQWWMKVIATTDPNILNKITEFDNEGCLYYLQPNGLYEHGAETLDVPLVKVMGKIGNDFVEAFVKEGGNISNIMVDYEDNYHPTKARPKLRDNLTVIIHSVKHKTYTREEFVYAVRQAWVFSNGMVKFEYWLNEKFPE